MSTASVYLDEGADPGFRVRLPYYSHRRAKVSLLWWLRILILLELTLVSLTIHGGVCAAEAGEAPHMVEQDCYLVEGAGRVAAAHTSLHLRPLRV